jgi:hypothetical protein
LYLAQDFETSLREYLQLGKSARLTPRREKEGAIVCFTAKVRLESVLDLTTDIVQKALSTDARAARKVDQYAAQKVGHLRAGHSTWF